jgi:tape measure domain-containing protein
MQDSNITFKVTAVGADEAQAKFNELGATIQRMTYNANGTVTASGKLSKTLDEQANSTDRAGKAANKAAGSQENYFVHIAKTTVQSALVNKAFLGLTASMGDAVRQVDLFTNFPAAMGALGLSTKDASASLVKLRDYAAQTGISLTEATQSVTRFAEVTKNVKAATAEFVGVKNALIAGGASALTQSQALEQLTQAYSRGRPQLIEWRSLMVAMPAQLTAVAKAMNQPSAQALGEQLTTGKIPIQDFMTELTKLSTGTGEIAKQTVARMQGIEYASNVMKQTLTNGLAAIYMAVGRQNIISFFTFMTQVIQVTAQYVVILINDLISLFNWISKVFGGPQIAHFSGEAQGAADALGDGAGNAGDMADGLGDAADNAKEMNKSLASFDKMNVLDKGKDKKTDPVGQNGIDAATAKSLEDIFGNLGGGLKEASKWAKIFAGILSGLAANALISKLFGINPLKSLISNLGDAAKNALGLGKNLEDAGKKGEKAGEKAGSSFGSKFGTALNKSAPKVGSAVAGFIGGIAGAVGAAIGPALIGVGTAVATAIGGVLAAGAAALGVSVGVFVLIIAAVVAIIVGIIWLIAKNWDTIVNFMKAVWNGFVGFLVAVWNTLYDIFAGPIKFILQFIEATVILIVALFAWLVTAVVAVFVALVKGIFEILSAIAGWVYDNVIKPVGDFFSALWFGVVLAAQVAWDFIFKSILAPIGSWIYNNVIVPVVNFFSGLWHTVSGFFSNLYRDITGFLAPVFNWISANVINPIANIFSGLWNGIKNGLSGMLDGLKGLFGSLGGIVKAPLNAIFDAWNAVARQINKIKVPDWVPGIGGKSVNFPSLTPLATGGVVHQATAALIGENGSEAVMPLENNTEWIDTLASKLNEKAGSGQPVQLIVQIGEDKVASKMIDLINEKTNMSGRNVIYV